MATDEKFGGDEGELSEDEPLQAELQSPLALPDAASPEEAGSQVVAPTQLGFRRFVYAAYFAVAIALTFVASKAGAAGNLALPR